MHQYGELKMFRDTILVHFVHPLLAQDTTDKVMVSIVGSRLDYCNGKNSSALAWPSPIANHLLI